jgi:RNA polymerase sigma-70 factor, ECF subfamily
MTAPPSMAELFATHGRFVWHVLSSHGVVRADVEDATQEVFLTVHRRMEDWDRETTSARTWLYSIARRVAANHRRRSSVRHEQPRGEVEPDPVATDPGESIDRERLLRKLDAALAQLDEGKRDVFILFELEDLPMAEVAEIAGCPLQTAYARLYAARKEVAAALRRGQR